MSKGLKKNSTRWSLVVYDMIVYVISSILLLWIYSGNAKLSNTDSLQQTLLGFCCIFVCRLIGNIYGQIWRYGGIQGYIRMIVSDGIAFVLIFLMQMALPIQRISFDRGLSLVCVNLLGAITIRMVYRYCYLYSNNETPKGKFLAKLLYRFSNLTTNTDKEVQKIKIAIVGAGRVGASFAEELLNDENAVYTPRCFIDVDKEKVGREVNGIPVWYADEASLEKLKQYEVQEIVFAIPSMDVKKKKCLYEHYKNAGYKVKVYDYPTLYTAGSKRNLREFDIEELLFRKPLVVTNEITYDYYKGKTILITGVGGFFGTKLLITPTYTASTSIYLTPQISESGSLDYNSQMANSKLVTNAVNLLTQNNIMSEVAKDVGLESAEKVKDVVTVTNESNTEIITVSATTTDPKLSKHIANDTVNTFIRTMQKNLNVSNIEVVDKAKLSYVPSGPNAKKNTLLATMVGFVLGCGYAVLRFLFDNRLRTKEEAEKYLGIPVFCEIPEL